MIRQSRVGPVYCDLSATHPDCPVVENVIATGLWLVSFKIIESKSVMEKEGLAPEGLTIIFVDTLQHNYTISVVFITLLHNWIKCFSFCGHAHLRFSGLKSYLKTFLYLLEMHVQQF